MRLQIADWFMQVDCDDAVAGQLPNLHPFLVSDPFSSDTDFLFRLQLGVSLSPEKTVPVLVNELEGRTLRLWLMPDHCSISLKLADSQQTYWLRASRDWKQIVSDWKPDYPGSYSVLNDFLMIAFIYSSAFRDTVLLHASCVAVGSEGCAFIGPSGVGKSTHSRLWLEHIPDSRLLNDDQPVLRRMPDGSMRIYGSPWSGKTFCYRNEGVRLNALFFMEQAAENRAIRLDGIHTFCRLLEAASAIGRDSRTFSPVSETLAWVAGTIPAYLLKNLPEKSAALLSAKVVFELKN